MPQANSIPAASNPVGRYPDRAPGATPQPKLLDRLRESLLSRHSFVTDVTDLLEGGYNIRTVQELLGHNNDVKTTMIYAHVVNRGPTGVCSPVDGL